MGRLMATLMARIVSLTKIAALIIGLLFVPHIVVWHTPVKDQHPRACVASDPFFRLGIEHMPASLIDRLKTGRNGAPLRIGLVMNQTSVDQCGRRTVDVLRSHGLQVSVLFAPEHGIAGKHDAGSAVENGVDPYTNIPIVSLYGGDNALKTLTHKDLEDVDVLMFDLQDSGMRHYTYIAILQRILDAAARLRKEIMVLDRPNPLGMLVEGSLIDSDVRTSFCCPAIPVRHGLTIGELAHFFNTHVMRKRARLSVIPMRGYRRTRGLNGIFSKPLSPNIAAIDSCYGYSFLGILGEVEPFDVGVGTDKAFRVILLPASLNIPVHKWYELGNMVRKLGIKTELYDHIHPRKGIKTTGLLLTIDPINEFSGMQALMVVLKFFSDNGVPLKFSSFFDTAVGTKMMRSWLDGKITRVELEKKMEHDTLQFIERAKRSCLYEPLPVEYACQVK